MVARTTTFSLKKNCRDQAQKVARDYEQRLSEQPGYQSAAFYLSDKDELVIFSTWNTREEAEAVTPAVRDEFAKVLSACSLARTWPHTEIGELISFDVSESADFPEVAQPSVR